MTEQEIFNHFGNMPVYKFNGTLDELNQLQSLANNSYNYLKIRDDIYFVAQNVIEDDRIVEMVKV